MTTDSVLDPAALDPSALEAELATLSAHLDAATHRQLTLIRLVDESGLWAHQGATSTPAWLNWRIGLALGAARERLRIARALVHLPAIDGAFSRGQLSYSKVRAMTRVGTPENEERLLDLALHATAAQLERICRSARSVERLEGRAARDSEDERWVRHRPVADGLTRVDAQLGADEAEVVLAALRRVRGSMRGGQAEPTLADALVRMAELASSEADAPPARAEPGPRGSARAPSMEYHPVARPPIESQSVVPEPVVPESVEGESVERPPEAGSRSTRSRSSRLTRTGGDRATLFVHLAPDAIAQRDLAATLDDGTRVSAETLRRVACDCGIVSVAEDTQGRVLDVGRKTRRIPPALRRAVSTRDRGCRLGAARARSRVSTGKRGKREGRRSMGTLLVGQYLRT